MWIATKVLLFVILVTVAQSLHAGAETTPQATHDDKWEEYIRGDLKDLQKDVKVLNDLVLRSISEQNERIKTNNSRINSLWAVLSAVALGVFGLFLNLLKEKFQSDGKPSRGRYGMDELDWKNGNGKPDKK